MPLTTSGFLQNLHCLVGYVEVNDESANVMQKARGKGELAVALLVADHLAGNSATQAVVPELFDANEIGVDAGE